MEKQQKQRRLLRSIYPSNFQDAILLELIETQKQLKVKNIFESNVPLSDIDLAHIANISESRFLKFKIKFLATLLTI